jgi:oxygen-independent coproporphyrinogen-3 oxidase
MLNSSRQRRAVPEKSLLLEFMMNSLRLREGFTLRAFESRTGLSRDQMTDFLEAGLERKLLQRDGENDEHIFPTDLGMRYLDDLLLLID